MLEDPKNAWLLEVDPQLSRKIRLLGNKTLQLLESSTQLERVNQSKDFETDPLEDDIIVNLRNKIFFLQLQKYSELAKTYGKPIFVIVGNEHVIGLKKMLSNFAEAKVRSFSIDQDFTTIAQLLFDVQFPKKKKENIATNTAATKSPSGFFKSLRTKMLYYFSSVN